MIITRKLELAVIGTEEEKNEAWKLIRYYSNTIPHLNNFIVTQIFLNDLIKEKFAVHDNVYQNDIKDVENKIKSLFEKLRVKNDEIRELETKSLSTENVHKQIEKIKEEINETKKVRNKLVTEAKKEAARYFKIIYDKSIDGSINEMIRNVDEFKDLPDTIISPAISELGFYKKELWKIKKGEERIRLYSKGMPFNTRGRDLKFYEVNGEEVYIKWVKGISFCIRFGKDHSNNREIMRRVMSGDYKASDSKIQLKGKRLFLLLCVDIPKKEHELIEKRVLGVDLGISVPAYISVNNGYFRKALGSADDFLKQRLKINKIRENLMKSVSLNKGGKGRNKKLKIQDRFESYERNWVKTYNHRASKEIINCAIKEGCKQINLEFLKGYGESDDNQFFLRNWSYYELQNMIEYKAKMNGIVVKYIDPYHTSQTCSCCGNYEQGQRIDQKTFICKNCNETMNADYNASKNIANSEKYVTQVKECEYFKNNINVL